MSTLAKRLELLERLLGREPECPACQDRPATVVVYDSIESDGPMKVSDSRCTACGSPRTTTRFDVIYDDEGPLQHAQRDEGDKECPI